MRQNTSGGPTGLDNIKHVVVVMFENRSFDHLFGAYPGVNGLMKNGQINQDYYNLPNPLEPPSPTNLPVYPTPVDPSLPQAGDFTHDFGDGMMPDLFGPTFTVSPANAQPGDRGAVYTSGFVSGAPTGQIQPTPQTYPATNSGFYSTYNSCKAQGQPSLSYFESGSLKVLHELAKHFVLFDNWHCDMPGHTLPNRAFLHCGATLGVGIDDPDGGAVIAPSLFNLIDQTGGAAAGPSWKMYVPVAGPNESPVLGQVDLSYLPDVSHGAAPITDFAVDCANGALPFYSFVMCWLPNGHYDEWTDTSMHPHSLVQPGENLLAALYNTLRNSPHWEDTLLIVTFDENGGLYDHVTPPAATPPTPNSLVEQSTPGSCGNLWILNSQFDFSLLGFRVPALLISPWLSAGVENDQYQNTSVTRFVVDRMNAVYGAQADPLTQRDRLAPSLDAVFTKFGRAEMRQDCPPFMEPYATLPSTKPNGNSNAIPYSDGTLTVWNPPDDISNEAPIGYIQELLNIYIAPLPGHPDSGEKITRRFASNGDVAAYVNERMQAAMRARSAPPSRAR